MKYQNQLKTIERLENQTHMFIKRIRNKGREQIQSLWNLTKIAMRSVIRESYRQDFQGSTWNMAMVARKGTLHRIDSLVHDYLNDFHQTSVLSANKYFKEIYRQSVLRHAYILDMVTPNSYKPILPNNKIFKEVDAETYQGPEADTAWKVRWSSWLDGYRSSLNTNLRMGILNESTIQDAENEVDATRAGSPAYDTGDALDRIFMSQAVSVLAMASIDLASMNDEMDIEEIWQTSFGSRVCDICDDQLGLTRDEADEDIPAHPNCECYWRLVPADWADLLRNGDADEESLARWMDAHGMISGSMIVRDEDGDPSAKVIVKFEDWIEGQQKVISGR